MVYPIFYKWFSGCCLTLRNFVCVMDCYVVYSTGVDIECRSQILHTHCRTFYMPPRKSFSPRTIPFHLPFCFTRKFPKLKVSRVFLFGIFFDSCSFFYFGQAESSVFFKFRGIEINPVGNCISKSFFFKNFY